MGLLPGESYLDYRKRVLENISPSFCAAKWLNATIWLNSGATVSCHHPPSHQIDLKEIKTNPSAIHNTATKKALRKEMLEGKRPSECEYCWKIEDLGKDHISDRVFKSVIYNDDDVRALKNLDTNSNVNLKTLEVAFDRSCQFACMYCNPSFSTTWANDIRKNGPYLHLPTDKRNHYTNTHEWAESKENNPYIEAFWKWWPELSLTLRQFRITGGEPLMSPNFWKLLEMLPHSSNPDLQIAVNSNLGASESVIEKLLQNLQGVRSFQIFTSGEAFGASGEYIRDGLIWDRWVKNMERLMSSGKVERMNIMMTINGLCLFSITEFLDQVMEWKSKFDFENPTISLNILRFPTFQSPLVLPRELLLKCRNELMGWYEKNKDSKLLIEFEKSSLARLIDYLGDTEIPTADASPREELERDLKKFLTMYDARRNKSFRTALRSDAVEWIESIGGR